MLKLSLMPLFALTLIACGGEPAKPSSADATEITTPTAATTETEAAPTATASAPAPEASASASAAPAEPQRIELTTEAGYPKELSDRIHKLAKINCKSGWTGSAELQIKDGKIVSYEPSEGDVPKNVVGQTVPKPPKELESLFSKPVMIGLCAGYIKEPL